MEIYLICLAAALVGGLLLSRLTKLLHLPAVTAYLVAGLIFGPFCLGAIGLPGDLSSASRFVRAVYHSSNARGENSVLTLFHLLSSVAMPDGSVKVGEAYERTEYTTVADLSTLTYYYRAYTSSGISAVKLFSENLDTPPLIRYPTLTLFSPNNQN